MGPLVAIQESARAVVSAMAHLLGGLGFAGGVNLPAINGGKEIQKWLDRLNPWVLAAAVDELADEAQGNPGVFRNGLEARSACFPKAALQVICNGFNGGGHGS